MRIAIAGTQGTGKTTLLKELQKLDIFKDYTIITELTRKLHKKGYPINEKGGDETQLILAHQCEDTSKIDNSIADRCVLDNIVFTRFLYNIGQVNFETLSTCYNIYRRNIKNFDIIFYIRPEFEIEDDGVRTTNPNTQKAIFDLFEYYIREDDVPVVLLTGSVEERVQQVLEAVNQKYK